MNYAHNVRRYFEFSQDEWRALLMTAVAAGFVLSFNDWGAEQFELMTGIVNLIFDTAAAFALLLFQLVVQKLVAIRLGLVVMYDKYIIGLLIGLFVAFFSFGYVPLFATGALNYRAIDNLRAGRFRAYLPKQWEMAFVAGGGILASLLLCIPFNLLHFATGLEAFQNLTVVTFLVGLYALLPLPVIKTTNPYAVYMSRMESLEGNTPGYDVLYASMMLYVALVIFAAFFGLLVLLFKVSSWTLAIAFVAGLLAIYLYSRVKIHFAEPGP